MSNQISSFLKLKTVFLSSFVFVNRDDWGKADYRILENTMVNVMFVVSYELSLALLGFLINGSYLDLSGALLFTI